MDIIDILKCNRFTAVINPTGRYYSLDKLKGDIDSRMLTAGDPVPRLGVLVNFGNFPKTMIEFWCKKNNVELNYEDQARWDRLTNVKSNLVYQELINCREVPIYLWDDTSKNERHLVTITVSNVDNASIAATHYTCLFDMVDTINKKIIGNPHYGRKTYVD
jgi:hypothetical protein